MKRIKIPGIASAKSDVGRSRADNGDTFFR